MTTLPRHRVPFERALAHERLGQWDDAYQGYNEAFQGARRANDLGEMLGCLLNLSRVLRTTQRLEAAGETAELAYEIARACGFQRQAARAMNMLAAIEHQRENWAGAESLYLSALDAARDDGDDELVSAISQNLGTIANAQGRLREAQSLYFEAIGAAVRSGSVHMAGMIYNNLGMVCTDLEEWTEAEVSFLRGAEIAERLGDHALMARLLTHRAEPLIRTGDFAAATESLARATAIAERLDDPRTLIDVHRFLGMIARLQGAYREADRHLEAALDIVRRTEVELSRGEVNEEIARLRRSEGRLGAANAVLREARRAFQAAGAARDVERVDALRAEWDAAAAGQATA